LRIARNLLLIVLVVLLLPYLLAILYRAGHPVSTLMAWRYLTGAPMSRQWIDLNTMSPALPRSVVASEDAKFCSHHGIDWTALREVIDDAEDGEVARGGSTITQQVAKNLFLWPGRSVIRKALEFPLALWIDLVLPKPRILEIYLNIAELGPSGQFGAQSGAIYAFGHPASSLSPRRNYSDAGAKIAVFELFGLILNLAFGHSIHYKRGLIGISARAKIAPAVRLGTMPYDNTPRGHRHGRSP
jgi:monofunctional biosynthetic peptidoglycan transglycosylase